MINICTYRNHLEAFSNLSSHSRSQRLIFKCCFFTQTNTPKHKCTQMHTKTWVGTWDNWGGGGGEFPTTTPPQPGAKFIPPQDVPAPSGDTKCQSGCRWPTHHWPQKLRGVGRWSKYVTKVKCETLTRMRYGQLQQQLPQDKLSFNYLWVVAGNQYQVLWIHVGILLISRLPWLRWYFNQC